MAGAGCGARLQHEAEAAIGAVDLALAFHVQEHPRTSFVVIPTLRFSTGNGVGVAQARQISRQGAKRKDRSMASLLRFQVSTGLGCGHRAESVG